MVRGNKVRSYITESCKMVIAEINESMFEIPRWYTLYTKPRHEKFVEEHLQRFGIDAYTPKITLRRKWSDRIQKVQEPLFKSYCFAKFPLKEKNSVISNAGVMYIVNFSKKYVPVSDETISSLKLVTENALKVDPCPYMHEGDKISIRKGPFKGFEGYILEKRNKNTTLVVSIEAIAASIKCVVDIDFVDLVYT